MTAIARRLFDRIDAADGQARHFAAEGLDEMSGRVRRGQKHRVPSSREFDREGRGHRRLADAAFAHEHEKSVTLPLDFIDERTQIREVLAQLRDALDKSFNDPVGRARGKPAERINAHENSSDRSGNVERGRWASSASIAASAA